MQDARIICAKFRKREGESSSYFLTKFNTIELLIKLIINQTKIQNIPQIRRQSLIYLQCWVFLNKFIIIIIMAEIDKKNILKNLKELNKRIFQDLQAQNRKTYKIYSQELAELLIHSSEMPQACQQFAVALYNLGKLSNRYKYIQSALEFKEDGIEKIKWNLQMLALASSKNSHNEAYSQACKLIDHILTLIEALTLQKQHQMFARQVIELIQRPKSVNVYSANTLNQLQMSRKFETECPYVNKKFHIADIMIMDTINFETYQQMPKLTDAQTLFYYVVFLSIACFTRATQKFYCRESSDRDFHFKAIEIAGYLYSTKSTYLRFLKRTYKQHYLEHLDEIEEVDEHGQLRVLVPIDPQQVPLKKMPWEQQQQQQVIEQ